MRTVLVLNSKGGSGKTTIVSNLAGYYASIDKNTVVKDYDPQGSSTEWLNQRSYSLPKIHGLEAYKVSSPHMTRVFQMRLPPNTDRLIIDTPAAVDLKKLIMTIRDVDKIVIPVSPSPIDIRATLAFINELNRFLKMHPCKAEIGIILNRAIINDSDIDQVEATFRNVDLPLLTVLSQNNNYMKAAERGVSLLELDHPKLIKDQQEWAPLINWIEGEEVMQCNEERPLFVVS